VRAELRYSLAAGSSVGVGDNPASQSDAASARTEALLAAQGRFQLLHIGGLTREQIGYGLLATSWTGNTGNTALTHTLGLSSEIEPTSGARLTLRGGGTLTQMSILDTAAASDPQTGGARPSGDQRLLSVGVGERFAWQVNAAWNIGQSLEGNLYRPLGSGYAGVTGNKSAAFAAEVAHTWQHDWVGLGGRLGAVVASGGTQTTDTTPVPDHSEFAQAELTWRHDWTPEVTHRLSAGASVLRAYDVRVLPAAAASVTWRGTRHNLELRAARTTDSNIYLGAAYERSLVGLTLGFPLDRYDLLQLFLNGDLERDSMVAASGGPTGTVDVLFLRSGLHWRPGDLFTFSLEYWFRDQQGSTPNSGPSAFSSLRRQMAMLTCEIQYPPRGFYR
jgi:hypothetical protein